MLDYRAHIRCIYVLFVLGTSISMVSGSDGIGSVIQCVVKGYEPERFVDIFTSHCREGIVLNVEVIDPAYVRGKSTKIGVIGDPYGFDSRGELFCAQFGFDLEIGSEFSLIQAGGCEIEDEYVIGENADLVYGFTYDESVLRISKNSGEDLSTSIEGSINAVEISRFNGFVITDCGDLMGSGLNAFNQIGSTEGLTCSGWRKVASDVEEASVGANYVLYVTNGRDLYGLGNVGGVLLGCRGDDNEYRGRLIAKNVKQVSAGANHFLFVDMDGVLWGAGSNRFGKLAITKSGLMRYDHPIRIDSDVAFCCASGGDTYYVKCDGSLWGLSDALGRLRSEMDYSFCGSVKLREGVSACGIYMRVLCILEDGGDLVVENLLDGSYETIASDIESFRATTDFLVSKNRDGVLVGTGAVPGHRYQSVGSWVTIADDVLHYSVCDGSLFYVDLGGNLHVFGSHRYLK